MIFAQNRSQQLVFGILAKSGKMWASLNKNTYVECCAVFKCKVFMISFFYSRAISFIDFILSALLLNLAYELDFTTSKHQQPKKPGLYPWILIHIMVNILCNVNSLSSIQRERERNALKTFRQTRTNAFACRKGNSKKQA